MGWGPAASTVPMTTALARSQAVGHGVPTPPRGVLIPSTVSELQALARSYTVEAFEMIVFIMGSPEANFAVRLQAANSILDRGWGKAEMSLRVTGEVERQVLLLIESLDHSQLPPPAV